jgi:molybdopterin molybdotransferase
MIDLPQALTLLRSHVRPLEVVEVALAEGLHRTLAAAVVCDVDFPPFDRSMMDGYAVRAADTAGAPVTLRLVGQIAAGHEPTRALQPGEAMQINTGAPMPHGADAVIRLEDTTPPGDGGATNAVTIRVATLVGKHVAARASFARRGQTALAPGLRLGPLEIAAAATCGAARVRVHRTPRVGVLVTGDELVPVTATPTGAEIRDSNRWMLEAMLRDAHVEPVIVGSAIDDREALRTAIGRAGDCDMLCITGGVSVGAFDFVPEVLDAAGATFHIRKMAIKPGKPVIFATMPGGQLVFALPGNPISAFVGFELLIRPALAGLQGRPDEGPRFVRATLRGSLPAAGKRRSFRPAGVAVDEGGRLIATPLAWQGSGDPFGMIGADALLMQPPDADAARDGDEVMILPLRRM